MNVPNTSVGVFDDLDKAERTIEELRRAGFRSDEIGIIGHVGDDQPVPTPLETNEPEYNATTGFMRGAAVGAIVGAFVMLVIPGLSEIAGLGQWFEIVGGAIFGAVICGLLIAYGTFIFMRPNTRLLKQELEKGNFIVTVKNPARKDEAVSVLRRQGMLIE